ncbi:Seizure protein 6 like, partial [Dissostichus eleginoides]
RPPLRMVDLSPLGGLQKAGPACTPPPKTRAGGSPLSPPPLPVNVPNHHPFYRNPPQHSQPKYFEDSRLSSSHSSFPTLPSGAPPDNNGDKKASDEFIGSSYMQTTLVMHGLAFTPHSHNPVPVTSQVLKDQAANIASAAREEDEVRSEEPELNALVEWQHSAVIILEWTVPQLSSCFSCIPMKPKVDSSNLNSADVGRPASLPALSCYEPLTVFHSKATLIPSSNVPCQMNLTGPDGYIKAPPQSSSAFQSTMDCSYVITVYMGYGVEVQ